MAKNKTITQILSAEPRRTLTVGIALVGLLVSLANFYILYRITPLALRVDAIERRNAGTDVLVPQFYLVQGDVAHIKSDMAEIKSDIRDIKNYINVR
jgi:hypothetical protein